MSKKIRVRISWNKRKPLEMAGIAHGVASAMDGNKDFDKPTIDPKDIETAATRVETAWANRKNGAIGKDELINSSNDLDDKLHTEATYVDGVANGDETLIHSAGYSSTSNSTARVAKPTVSLSVSLTPMKGGMMKAKIVGAKGARGYCFVLVEDTAFNYTIQNGVISVPTGSTANAYIIYSTKGGVSFSGLTPLKNVSVAAIVFNSAGDSGFSPVATSSTIA